MSTATDTPAEMACYYCSAGLAACNSRRMLSGRRCCSGCVHSNAPGPEREVRR